MVNQETGGARSTLSARNDVMDTHPRTRAAGEPTDRRQTGIQRRKEFLPVAQAACCSNCFASKRTPFFQTSKVMAAILHARVSRAIAGFMPLAMRAS